MSIPYVLIVSVYVCLHEKRVLGCDSLDQVPDSTSISCVPDEIPETLNSFYYLTFIIT